MALGIVLLICLLILLVGLVVMLLWNHVLSPVLEIKQVTYWQAVGILVLCKILFGGIRGGSHKHKRYKGQWQSKWMDMNEEDRHAFKSKWDDYCEKRQR